MIRATELPAEAVRLLLVADSPSCSEQTGATTSPLFDAIRACVSHVPMRRPNRTRPIDRFTGGGSPAGQGRD